MSQLLVDDIVNKDDTGAPGLSKGIVVTGITTSDSAIVGYGVTINSTGIQIEAGIVTAFCTKVGSAVTINPSGIDAVGGIVTAFCAKVGSGVTINPTGIEAVGVAVTAGSFVATGTVSASGAAGGLATEINAKASTGKAIAMAMVFG